MRARLSDVNRKQYDRVSANGTVEIRQLVLNAADLRQPLNIDEAKLTLSPQHAQLSSFRGRVGSSDLTMTGSLENVLGFVLGKEDLRGTATLASQRFDLNEWRSDDELKSIVVPPRIDFTLRAAADTVKYGILSLRNTRGTLRIKDQRATLEDFKMNVLGGELGISGFYETRPDVRPAFDLAVNLANVVASSAFTEISTIQAFAPVARYAEGNVSAQMKLNGELGKDMMPVLENLTGLGSLLTSSLVLRDFPPLEGLAEALKLQQLRDPGFMDLKSSFAIDKGRLHVKPFDVRAGPLTHDDRRIKRHRSIARLRCRAARAARHPGRRSKPRRQQHHQPQSAGRLQSGERREHHAGREARWHDNQAIDRYIVPQRRRRRGCQRRECVARGSRAAASSSW